MSYIIGLLIFIILMLVAYCVYIQVQIRSMNNQLEKRLRDNNRQPISLELINRDLNQLAAGINKCLRAEENLRLNGIREEKRFRELIADISHDLRTPLTAIKGYQQLLGKDDLTSEQRNKLEIIRKHTDELGQLIEHFFEYSYLLNSEPEVHMVKFNLTQLVTECLISFVSIIEEKQLTLHFDEDTPPIYITADPEHTTRMLQNLIRNCLQHSSGNISVQLFCEKYAIISFQNPVKDPESIDISRLFDRFYTGDRARSRSTGLGLSIVKLLAEQMGGSVMACLQNNILEIRVSFALQENPKQ